MRPLARGAQTPKNSIIERFDIENSHLRRGLEVLSSKTSLKHQLAQWMKYPMVVLRDALSHFKHVTFFDIWIQLANAYYNSYIEN